MMKFKFILAASLFALASQTHAAAVNLVVNGSFEDTPRTVSAGTYDTFSSINGWSTTGGGIEIRNNHVGTASDGDYFAELDSTRNSNIFQTIATTAGQAYTLSFDYSPRMGQVSNTNGISALWNGSIISVPAVITGSGVGNTDNVWTNYVFTVIGTGSDILGFNAAGRSDTFGGSLDSVSLSAVPIPAAAFLFAPALLGFMGLRRKAKNVAA